MPSQRKTFNPSIPAILPYKQSTERGIFVPSIARLAGVGTDTAEVGTATAERVYRHYNWRKAAERISLQCPQILGIDEHTVGKNTALPPPSAT
mgnify:FL=1